MAFNYRKCPWHNVYKIISTYIYIYEVNAVNESFFDQGCKLSMVLPVCLLLQSVWTVLQHVSWSPHYPGLGSQTPCFPCSQLAIGQTESHCCKWGKGYSMDIGIKLSSTKC